MPVANRIDGLTRTLGYVDIALVPVGAAGGANDLHLGLIFLIATVFLLSAFVRANW